MGEDWWCHLASILVEAADIAETIINIQATVSRNGVTGYLNFFAGLMRYFVSQTPKLFVCRILF